MSLYGDEVRIAVCTALPKEFLAMKAILEIDPNVQTRVDETGIEYLESSISALDGGFNRIVLCRVGMGNNLAAARATQIMNTYPKVRAIVMVGIAGGMPNPGKAERHVRLGDVVVSNEEGIWQYDLVKDEGGKETVRAHSSRPDAQLLGVVGALETKRLERGLPLKEMIEAALATIKHQTNSWSRPSPETDKIFDTSTTVVQHPFDPDRAGDEPRVFMGRIGSANVLLKNALRRDQLRDEFGLKAVEMEGSGIADAAWLQSCGYLVVRGICDYADQVKNDTWQNYAALAAAAYAKLVLLQLPSKDILSKFSPADLGPANNFERDAGTSALHNYLSSLVERNADWARDIAGNWSHMVSSISPLDILELQPYGVGKTERVEVSSLYSKRRATIVGETGSGKSSMMRFLCHRLASNYLNRSSTGIPVRVELRDFSENRNLQTLIEDSAPLGALSGRDSAGRMVYLLDGFDECTPLLRPALARQIRKLCDSGRASTLVSTRDIDTHLLDGAKFKIRDLTFSVKETVLRKELGSGFWQALQMLHTIGYWNDIRTILELAMVTFLLKRGQQEVQSKTRILQSFVKHVGEAYHGNSQIHVTNWEILSEAHDELAYIAAQAGTSIGKQAFDETIMRLIAKHEERLSIRGVTTISFSKELEQIGFLAIGNESVYFKLRSLMHFHAARHIARKHPSAWRLSNVEQREDILVLLAGLVEDASPIIKLLASNLWFAASAMAEAKFCNAKLAVSLKQRLRRNIESEIPEIRNHALHMLLRLPDRARSASLKDLFLSSTFVDIRMTAIERLALTKTDDARRLVLDHLDWNQDTGFLGGGSRSAIIRGLSQFGPSEFRRIITLWQQHPDMWTGKTACEALASVHDRGLLGPEMRELLVDFFEDEISKPNSHRLFDLERLLIHIKVSEFAAQLLPHIAQSSHFEERYHAGNVLEAIMEPDIVQEILRILQASVENGTKEFLSGLLVKAECPLPLNAILELTHDPNIFVACNAVKCLGRFTDDDVGERLTQYLQSDDPFVLSAAVEAFIANGRIDEVLSGLAGRRLLVSTLEKLAIFIGENDLLEHIEIVRAMRRDVDQSQGQSLDLFFSSLRAEFKLGFVLHKDSLAPLMVDGNLNVDPYTAKELLKRIDLFHPDTQRWLVDSLQYMFTERDHFRKEEWFAAIETIRDREAVLRELGQILANSGETGTTFTLERPLRSLLTLGSSEQEEIVFEILRSPTVRDTFVIKRAIECLNLFGTKRSLREIKKLFQDREGKASSDYVKDACLYAFQSIVKRNGYRGKRR